MKVPILFIIFNRPEIAAASFEAIRQYKPDRLYIAADGPRDSRPGESELCRQTRDRILNLIDWDCDIRTLFRDKNVGVDFGVYGAINWMFETEPWGVIIEDDCYVSQDFFHLCEDAFPRYKDEERVMHIIANNPWTRQSESNKIEFTYFMYCWGWATWANKWHDIMDVKMNYFPKLTVRFLISNFGLFQGLMFYRQFKSTYKNRHIIKTWDSIWLSSIIANKGLCLIPLVNLAVNGGIGTCEGTHYELGEKNYYEGLKLGHLSTPYSYPDIINISKEVKSAEKDEYFKLKMFGLKKKIRRLLHISR